jgi:hypothetical protein
MQPWAGAEIVGVSLQCQQATGDTKLTKAPRDPAARRQTIMQILVPQKKQMHAVAG